MKRCPECERTYSDNSLNFCLEDGATLLTAAGGDPITAILPGDLPPSELPTRQHSSTANEKTHSETGTVNSRPTLSSQTKKIWFAILIPVVALAIVVSAYRYWNSSNGTSIDSIAVMPFENLNANADTDYLSDGISEALINSLTQLQQLKVVARSTAFRYKGKEIDPKAVGRELGVGSVLMGRVRQVGDSLEVQVDLVDTNSGTQLWGQEFERRLSDVVTIKQTIAREVTDKLRLRLSGEQQERLAKNDPTNADAYQFYLKGRYFWNKRTPDGMNKAVDQFQNAINLDRNYALGYVGLADCYLLMEEISGLSPSETLPKARSAIDSALRIDDSLSEAHTSSASIYQASWQWTQAEAEFRRAISLNPNYPTAHHWFSIFLRIKGQTDDSIREINEAQRLDPMSSVIGQNVAELDIIKNDLDASIEKSKSIINLDPNFPGAHNELGWAYLKQKHLDDAIAEFQKAVELSGRTSRYLGDLGYGYAVAEKRADAQTVTKELEAKYAAGNSRGQFVAAVYAGLNDRDQVFAWLEKDLNLHCGIRLPYARWWFTFDDVRSDPRYSSLILRMGL